MSRAFSISGRISSTPGGKPTSKLFNYLSYLCQGDGWVFPQFLRLSASSMEDMLARSMKSLKCSFQRNPFRSAVYGSHFHNRGPEHGLFRFFSIEKLLENYNCSTKRGVIEIAMNPLGCCLCSVVATKLMTSHLALEGNIGKLSWKTVCTETSSWPSCRDNPKNLGA